MSNKLINMQNAKKYIAKKKNHQININDIRFIRKNNGQIKNNFLMNIVIAIEHDSALRDRIRFNEFENDVYIKHKNGWAPLQDSDVTNIQIELEKRYKFTPNSSNTLSKGIDRYAMKHKFNPVKDMVNSVKWDHKDRIGTIFCDYLGAKKDAYDALVGFHFMCGAVARILHPGIKFEMVPVLYGKQGIGKSTLCSKLANGYGSDDIPRMRLGNRETTFALMKSWIVEIPELSEMGKSSVEDVKAFLSEQADQYRELYAKRTSIYRRHNVFVGTTNTIDFLRDKTGNRRFFPVHCGVCKPTKDVFHMNEDDILQMYAEARFYLKKAGSCALYLSQKEEKLADKVRLGNEESDPMEDAIRKFLNIKVPKDWYSQNLDVKKNFLFDVETNSLSPNFNLKLYLLKYVSLEDILSLILKKDKGDLDNLSKSNIGKRINLIMQHIPGWVRKRGTINGKRKRGYFRINKE